MSLRILNSGILSLLQDLGRFGQHSLGLTTGGPMDPLAFRWANKLLGNDLNCAAIEITVGGFKAVAEITTHVVVTGAKVDVRIDGELQPQWQTLELKQGQEIDIAYATEGCRIYLAVAGGFNVAQQFSSVSTVLREGVGGMEGKHGGALSVGDSLPIHSLNTETIKLKKLVELPSYSSNVRLRVIPGYQEHLFSREQQRRFFNNQYEVSDLSDRMGYRLKGPVISCDVQGMLSEGICLGAIQIPADGHPIILMNDRQTIGGYPKIGSVLSLDLAKLAQLTPKCLVQFEPITIDRAHNLLHLAQHKFEHAKVVELDKTTN
jgi:biotin-dependent carboxylase-like uncharacterized protein